MKLNFCTLFDSNYLFKGLALYSSLVANCSSDFTLWILCMDDLTFEILSKINLSKVKLVDIHEFESLELLEIKKERNVAEYSWTCASNFIWFILQKNNYLDKIIYLDADLYFFDDPKILIEELDDQDVMITEHRYSKKYDQAAVSGIYCVQFMVFRNNDNGLMILDWWRRACLNWCFDYLDNGRFGDQKYLDDWPFRFYGVYKLQHLGGGVAPWNVSQYNFFISNCKVFGSLKNDSKSWPLIFYHFHSFCLLNNRRYLPTIGYSLSKRNRKIIYEPYSQAIKDNIKLVHEFYPNFNFGYKKISFIFRIKLFLLNFSFIKLLVKSINLVKDKRYD